MSLNVKSSVEVNTSNAQASINNLTNALNKFNKQSEETNKTLNKIADNTNTFADKLAHSAQAINGWYDITQLDWVISVLGNFRRNFTIEIPDQVGG